MSAPFLSGNLSLSVVTASQLWVSVKNAAYGAIGDGVTDDTAAVQAALTAVNALGGGTVFFPPGVYLCNDLTIPGSNITVAGAGWRSIIKQKFQAGDNHYLLSVNPGSGGTSSYAGNTTGIAVSNLQLLGTVAADGFQQHVFLLNLNACSDTTVRNVFFNGFRGDGLYLGSGNNAGIERHNRNIKVYGCLFDGVNNQNRNCISIIDGDGILIADNWFRNSTQTGMPGAIDMEVNAAYSVNKDITIRDNVFDNIGGSGSGVIGHFNIFTQAALTTPVSRITIKGNTLRNCTNDSAIGLIQQQQTSLTTAPSNFVIEGNRIDGAGAQRIGIEIDGIRDVKIRGNLIVGTTQPALALGYTYKSSDVKVVGNTFRSVGTGGASNDAITLYRADRTTITDNTFDSIGLANGTFGVVLHLQVDGGATGASDTIEFARNEIIGTTATNLWIKAAAHAVASVSRNRSYQNRTGGLSTDQTVATPAALPVAGSTVWNPGAIANLGTATTTVTVNGAAVGDPVYAGHTGLVVAGWTISAVVSATNTVIVTITNNTGGSLTPTGTLTAAVMHTTT